MRLSTDENRDDELALETIAAAADAGITVFDTARSYGLGAEDLGHNERLLARALRRRAAHVRVVTKGGMARTGGGWFPDGRAKTIRADCEASLADLAGLGIDLYLLHAPDPRTPWRTSVRALAKLLDERLVARIGLSNVYRTQLDEAVELAPISAVQVAISPFDDRALRGGVLERCAEAGIAVIAHSPLGGPRRAGRLARHELLTEIAAAHDATPAEVALAWLVALGVIAIPGARRPDTARSAARAATLELDQGEREALNQAFGAPTPSPARRPRRRADADVVLVMGIPGAGKARFAAEYVDRGYLRLNRDERGGTLRDLADALDDELGSGVRRVVLDNTYLTRASRSHVVETASRHRAPTRCIWLDTPLAQAQVNLVERLLERFGTLPGPEELRALSRREPDVLGPTSQMRALRELEPPGDDEGFSAVEQVAFVRTPPSRGRAGCFVAAAALGETGWTELLEDRGAPHLVFDWSPDGSSDELAPSAELLAEEVSGPVATALCPHPGGPPTCWCRPPLPGLLLAFAREHQVDPARSTLIGTSSAHRTLATTLGARYVQV